MLDRIGRAAERAARGVSRRDFLGRLGRGAAVVAAGLGGVLLAATDAHAAGGLCCVESSGGIPVTCKKGQCPKHGTPYPEAGYTTVRCSDNPGFCPQ